MAARAIADQTTGDITIVEAWDRTVDGSEGASFTFTLSGSDYLEAVILLISGGAVTASNTATDGGNTSITVTKPGSPVAGDTLLVVVANYSNGLTWSPPAGWTSATTAYDTHASTASTGTTSASLPDVTTATSAGVLVGVQIGYSFDRSTTPSGWSDVTNWDGVNRVWSKSYSASGSQGGPWSYTIAGSSTAATSVFAYSSGGGGGATATPSTTR